MDPISGGADFYQYDADGRRIHRQTSTFTGGYIYDNEGNHVADVEPSGTVILGEVYANGKHLATFSTGSNPGVPAALYFHHTDWLGTERVRSNGYGMIYETCTSWVYGDQLQCSANDATQTHFTGKERDTESGLDYFGARYYESGTGRWLSPDWSAKAAAVPYAKLTDPQSLNLYNYVAGNPVTRVDADGHMGDLCKDFGQYCAVAKDIQNRADQVGKKLGQAAKKVDRLISTASDYLQDHPVLSMALSGGLNPEVDETEGPAVQEEVENVAAASESEVSEAASASKTWTLGAFKSATKWANQMLKRGWTDDDISEAIEKGTRFPAPNNINPANGATRYVNPSTGKSVVVDNITKEVLHVGGNGFSY